MKFKAKMLIINISIILSFMLLFGLIFVETSHANPYQFEIDRLTNYIELRKSNQPIELSRLIAKEVIKQCKKNAVSIDIIVGIIEIESMWNVYAKSKAKARGLMQILIEDGVVIDPKKAYDIEYNIAKGIAIFKSKLRKANGNMSLALEYYVGGDKTYHAQVYKYMGKWALYKLNNSNVEIIKMIKIKE